MAIHATIEPLTGTVDGANKVFTTTNWYATGSTCVFRNGVVARANDADGWSELGQNKIEMNEAPAIGDIMQAYYIPT